MGNYVLYILDVIEFLICSISSTIKDDILPRVKVILLYPFAKAGIVRAQLSIANTMYEHYWLWNPKNPEKWLEKGIKRGIPFALILKGHFLRYEARQIEEEEYPTSREAIPLFFEALNFYKKAADMDNALGQFYLFAMYDNYRHRLNLKPTGARYLRLAAENGQPNAQYIFAEKCLSHDDLKNGVYWMKRAANSRMRDWVRNDGYYPSRKKARKWYKNNKDILEVRKKAFRGDPKATYDYSQFLMHDSPKRDSLHLAHEWHTRAAKAGYPKAMGEEGNFIIHGWVVGTMEEAFEYYTRAYESGYKMASWGLGDCFYYG